MILICSWEEVERVCKTIKEQGTCDFIVSIGGGKAVDLGKAVATVIILLLLHRSRMGSRPASWDRKDGRHYFIFHFRL